jgi:hypothetical protein
LLPAQDNDLCSALMLERTAECMRRMQQLRKAALHLVLAGHRYAKAGLRVYALR